MSHVSCYEPRPGNTRKRVEKRWAKYYVQTHNTFLLSKYTKKVIFLD